MRSRSAMSLLELAVAGSIGLGMLLSLISLSSSNAAAPEELMDREMMETLCLDTLDRLKGISLDRPLPGGRPVPPLFPEAPPLAAMFGPVELDPARMTEFDALYLDRLRAMGARVVPEVERIPDPDDPALFRLTVTIAWRDRRGVPRRTRESRWCWAPLASAGDEDPG